MCDQDRKERNKIREIAHLAFRASDPILNGLLTFIEDISRLYMP